MVVAETYLIGTLAGIIGRIIDKKVDSFIMNKLEKKEINRLLKDCVNDINKSGKSYRKKLNKGNIKDIIYNPLILKQVSNLIGDKTKFKVSSVEKEINNRKLYRKKLIKKLEKKEIKDISKEITTSIKKNLKKYPGLTKSFQIDRLESIQDDVKNMPRRIVRVLKSEYSVRGKYSGWGPWNGLGIFQQEIIGMNLKRLIDELKKHYSWNGYAGFKKFVEKNDGFFEVNYSTTQKNITFEIDVEDVLGDPLKVLVPNRKTIKIWFRKRVVSGSDLINITHFSTDKESINQISEAIRSCLSSKTYFKDVTLDKKMKSLIKKFGHGIHILGVNPRILEKIKLQERDQSINITKKVVNSDEPGLPKTKFGINLLNKVKEVDSNEVSDIYYFKTKRVEIRKNAPLVTMIVYRDGRIYFRFKPNDFKSNEKKFEFFNDFLESIK